MLRKTLAAALILGAAPAFAADPADWDVVLAEARGQTVYWNAWAGDSRINAYIDWAGEQVSERYGVRVEHVKLSDTAEAVSRVLAEKTAGKDEGGAVDLIWINGENFAAMKRNDLLFGPWSEATPNYRFVDVEGKPAVASDFTVPVEGLESPWGMAQFIFYYDSASLSEPPKTLKALGEWAAANPGRFTYPQPPDFLGSTFLKQALYDLTPDRSALSKPVSEADFDAATAPLWAFLDGLTPSLWRKGQAYPQNGAAQRSLVADGAIDIGVAFDPAEPSSAIANGLLPDSVRSFVFDGGTIGNAHFVAIPYNAAHKAGAMVLANFLLSPQAQARKQDPEYWGSATVLALDKLSVDDRAAFDALDLGVATLGPDELGSALPEPHPSWMVEIEKAWSERMLR